MKSLLLIRHAKSSWNDFRQKDFDRPLDERGKKNAPLIAGKLHLEKNISIDAIITSPAKRAITTASFFAEEFNVKKKNIFIKENLYEASFEDYYNTICDIDNTVATAALFAHNPFITAFANILTDVRIDDMPTCGVFALHINTNSWKKFKDAEKQFWFFDYPKNIM